MVTTEKSTLNSKYTSGELYRDPLRESVVPSRAFLKGEKGEVHSKGSQIVSVFQV